MIFVWDNSSLKWSKVHSIGPYNMKTKYKTSSMDESSFKEDRDELFAVALHILGY